MIHAFRFDILILLVLVTVLTLNMTMGGSRKSDSAMLNSICAQHGAESDSSTESCDSTTLATRNSQLATSPAP